MKLLRVLQEREFERVGGERTLRVDVRLIAATHRDLDEEVAAGRFRSDLYYRLNVFPLVIPPLRERPEDIGPLAQHFVAHFGRRLGKPLTGISRGSFARLNRYPWPGNIRELQNVIERACVLATGPVVDVPEPALGATRAAVVASGDARGRRAGAHPPDAGADRMAGGRATAERPPCWACARARCARGCRSLGSSDRIGGIRRSGTSAPAQRYTMAGCTSPQRHKTRGGRDHSALRRYPTPGSVRQSRAGGIGLELLPQLGHVHPNVVGLIRVVGPRPPSIAGGG